MAKRFSKGVFPWERKPNPILAKEDVGIIIFIRIA